MSDSEQLYARAKAVFLNTIKLPASARSGFLDEQCRDDAQLRAEVESLLQHHAEDDESATATSALEGSAFDVSGPPEPATGAVGPFYEIPATIGGYRIIREIGRGGMGIVYLAVREEGRFQRRAALKVIKRGMDSDQILQRFELERQVLSALNHPNVARLYDAGTTEDGRPYFAMEYVDGMPIDKYCDRHRLSIDERLNLFSTVCGAVQYAHGNLVVHRDLKPANILVTNDNVPKLLDFGIAKLLNPEMSLIAGDPTAPEFRVMTPEYASPEQVRGEQVATTSDVYSLGVLLYELLTGHRPYRIRSRLREEIERIVCEEEPERPSTAISRVEDDDSADGSAGASDNAGKPSTSITLHSVSKTRNVRPDQLRRRLAGDIDNIIMMAMRKEPQRRYSSVEKLAEDIERHLNRMPVSARPSSLLYSSGKFVRRNKAGVAIAALVVLAAGTTLAAGWNAHAAEAAQAQAAAADAIATSSQALAEAERTRAESRAMSVRDLIQVLLFDFHDAVQRLDGGTPARELLVMTALQYLEALHEEGDADPAVQRQIAIAYDRVGDLQGGIRSASLGDTAAALASHLQAQALRQALVDRSPDDAELLREVATNHIRIGDMRLHTGDTNQARIQYDQALEIFERLVALDRGSLAARRGLTASLNQVGAVLVRAGEGAVAKEYYLRSLDVCRTLADEHVGNTTVLRDLSVAHLRVAGRLAAEDDVAGALTHNLQALEIRQRLSEMDPFNAWARRDVGITHYAIAGNYFALDDIDESRRHYAAFRDIISKLAADNPDDERVQRDMVLSYQTLGDLLLHIEDFAGALENYQLFHELVVPLAEADPANTYKRQLVALSHESLGRVLALQGTIASAVDHHRQAVAITTSLVELDSANQRFRETLLRQQEHLEAVLSESEGR